MLRQGPNPLIFDAEGYKRRVPGWSMVWPSVHWMQRARPERRPMLRPGPWPGGAGVRGLRRRSPARYPWSCTRLSLWRTGHCGIKRYRGRRRRRRPIGVLQRSILSARLLSTRPMAAGQAVRQFRLQRRLCPGSCQLASPGRCNPREPQLEQVVSREGPLLPACALVRTALVGTSLITGLMRITYPAGLYMRLC